MPVQLSQAKIFPAQHCFHGARDERTCRQHQCGVGREIDCDLDSVSARTHADRAALPVRCQQNHRHRQNVREQIRKLVELRTFDFRGFGNEKL